MIGPPVEIPNGPAAENRRLSPFCLWPIERAANRTRRRDDPLYHTHTMSVDRVIVSRVHYERLLDLRHRVLLPDADRDAVLFEGDAEPTAIHLAALNGWDMVVGCATLIARPWNQKPAWQLRGMAVDPAVQRAGVGRLLLAEIDQIVRHSDHAQQLWCNARKVAIAFYEKHGWQLASAEFQIPGAGPHYKMTRRFESADPLSGL
jgi:GNAT superfamily N-acetyltransferase